MERYRIWGPMVGGWVRVLDRCQLAYGYCEIVHHLSESTRFDKRDADRYMISVPPEARKRREVQTV
jgi:hypothetical protein